MAFLFIGVQFGLLRAEEKAGIKGGIFRKVERSKSGYNFLCQNAMGAVGYAYRHKNQESQGQR